MKNLISKLFDFNNNFIPRNDMNPYETIDKSTVLLGTFIYE